MDRSIRVSKIFFGKITHILGNIQLRANFSAGAFSNYKELMEFWSASSFKPLGNIRHDGNTCPSVFGL